MQELLEDLLIEFIQTEYPLPVDLYVRLVDEGVDVDSLIEKHTK